MIFCFVSISNCTLQKFFSLFINFFLKPYINLKFYLLNFLLVFTVLFLFWLLGGIGGGDVKILTALFFYAGFKIWDILLWASVIFIFYSLILRKFRTKLPFMPAVFAGTLVGLFIDF
ncbi:prepilin peptidase [Thermoanaerobacter uzonensis]|uniref:prepilin peptidase n=1 Tax=Thermoanaerobacter uzonensis TaxID=447593 RepID=UPI000933090C|nr:prepilin peptidase [Thermoanaerobacter uzonensis]